MEKKNIEMQKSNKKWRKPEMETITPKELSETISAGACSYNFVCTLIRMGR